MQFNVENFFQKEKKFCGFCAFVGVWKLLQLHNLCAAIFRMEISQ
jgi:hypothetical protein